MKSCFRLSLHSSHSAAITAFPSDHSTSWKQLSIISGLCHTQKACSTSLMVRRGWCGKDAACKWEEIRRNIWELGNDVFKWLVRPGWATNINNVCAQGLPNISWNLRGTFYSQSPCWNNSEAVAVCMSPLTSWFSTPGTRLLSPLNVLR